MQTEPIKSLPQALESAYKRLSETQTVSLNPQDQQQFLHLLENPSPLTPIFARAIERYKKVKEITTQ